jgi:hypothetical protein
MGFTGFNNKRYYARLRPTGLKKKNYSLATDGVYLEIFFSPIRLGARGAEVCSKFG